MWKHINNKKERKLSNGNFWDDEQWVNCSFNDSSKEEATTTIYFMNVQQLQLKWLSHNKFSHSIHSLLHAYEFELWHRGVITDY